MENARLFPVYPSPTGLNTPAVESLSSYVQRLAAANCLSIASIVEMLAMYGHLPLPRRISSRFLRTIDTQLAFVPSPLFMTGTPWEVFSRLSLTALFRAFYGPLLSNHVSIHTFFATPYGKRSFETTRRWLFSDN